jgi:hypothetical protein
MDSSFPPPIITNTTSLVVGGILTLLRGRNCSMGSYLASGVVAVLCSEVKRGGSQPVRGEGRTARHEAAHALRVAVPRSRQQLLTQLHQ